MKKVFGERAREEGGFTIVESIVGLTLIMSVLIGSLAMMGASVKGIVTSRQRSVATSMAREVVERARGANYESVGHDLNDDATLTTAADAALTGTPLTFEGRALVGSNVDKDTTSPFFPHLRTESLQGVTYTTWAYAVAEVPAIGDPYKRVTVVVRWSNDQYQGAVDTTVRLETVIFPAAEPPDPLLLGEAEVDAGAIRVLDSPEPLLAGDGSLEAATLFLPFARSEVESRFVRTARSFARTARTELRVDDLGGLSASSGCTATTSDSESTAECPGVATDVIADNDAGTAPAIEPAGLAESYAGGTAARTNGTLSLVLGATNLASSLATAASTTLGSGDGLPYAESSASGPASYSMPFSLGAASGSLATFSGPASTAVEVDREGTGTSSTVSAEAQVSHPALDLLTFTATPANSVDGTALAAYAGMVRAGAASVTASAAAGPSAAAGTFSGAAFTVSLFQTDALTGAGSYLPVTVTPGAAASVSTTATFTVGGQPVTVEATLVATPKLVTSVQDGTTTESAGTRMSSWLKVQLDVVSSTTDHFSYELDYGRIVAETSYEEPT